MFQAIMLLFGGGGHGKNMVQQMDARRNNGEESGESGRPFKRNSNLLEVEIGK